MSSFVYKSIRMTLDTASIDAAIRDIEYIAQNLKPAAEALVEQLTYQGVEVAKATLVSYDPPAYYTGQLTESIFGSAEGTHGVIATDLFYAIYVEFGTGSVGQGSARNPAARNDGTYTEGGWWYFNDRDGKFHFTTGMEARPFMYDTLRALEADAENIGVKILAEYIV